ncbi:outer membrane beta-barrel protein [Marinobacter salexigens]|uniref:outer membrane beta-barrel protein n=1 Tax=Marinobacter salexigens TaxID=1925763 RepID=UPI000C286562|nr:outer membrane beta-barrel protein [Marinobacter salexigens]
MPIAILLLMLCLPGMAWAGWLWGDDEPEQRVQVVEPFVVWRTGPAVGYPVFHSSEKGEWLTLLQRKTGWMKVRDGKGREGWVAVAAIAQTQDATGERVNLSVPNMNAYSERTFEAGILMGEFEGNPVTAGYGGYWFTPNLAAELSGSQVLGSASEILMVNANIVHQPFPHLRVSPYFTLGVGHIWVDPKATLAVPEERDNSVGHAGLGVRVYITERYFIRAEFKDYKVFTSRSTNEEATEWKIGLSIFF